MDEVTKSVKEMYEKYPFPSSNIINEAHGNRILNDLKIRNIDCRGIKILDAGCGTGEKAISFARVFKESQVYGWDICQSSIEKAGKLAKADGINNVTFESVNLLQVDLDRYKNFFDIIISWGVIHHLSDTVLGLKNLGVCLKPNGRIYVWVYAKNSLGRIEGRIFREAINVLLKEKGFSYEEGIKIVHAIKGLLKTQNYSGRRDFLMRLKWFFDKDVNKKQVITHILKNFRKIKYTTDYDVNIVDSFLHANEKDYDIDMCFDEAQSAGLEIIDFLDMPQQIEKIVDSEYVKGLYNNLAWRDRLKVMERLTDAGHHLFLAKRK